MKRGSVNAKRNTTIILALLLALALLFVAAQIVDAAELIPPGSVNDLSKTPGATNPDITQDNIKQTICNRGHWTTKSIRPPTTYTNKLKKKQIAEYGFKDKNMKAYEEDHLIPIELGGNPRDPRNLWPEKWDGKYGAHVKDKLENRLHKLVCNGTLTLKAAQTCISRAWITCYKKYLAP
jgi:hypothetical protein